MTAYKGGNYALGIAHFRVRFALVLTGQFC